MKHITLRRDDHPLPPCVLVMVISDDDGVCTYEYLDANESISVASNQLHGLDDAIERFDRLSDEMTGKSARIGREKLEELRGGFPPFEEWVTTLKWWVENPDDRPDGYDVMMRAFQ